MSPLAELMYELVKITVFLLLAFGAWELMERIS